MPISPDILLRLEQDQITELSSAGIHTYEELLLLIRCSQKSTVLQTLHFRDIPVNLIAGNEMARVLTAKRTALKTLSLQNAKMRDDVIRLLATALTGNQTLTSLNLGGNAMSDDGAVALANMLRQNKILTSLDLGANQVSNEGARALADGLERNATLVSLNLERNQVNDPSIVERIHHLLRRNRNFANSNKHIYTILQDGYSTWRSNPSNHVNPDTSTLAIEYSSLAPTPPLQTNMPLLTAPAETTTDRPSVTTQTFTPVASAPSQTATLGRRPTGRQSPTVSPRALNASVGTMTHATLHAAGVVAGGTLPRPTGRRSTALSLTQQ